MDRLLYFSFILYIWSCQSTTSSNENIDPPSSIRQEQASETPPSLAQSRSLTTPKCPLKGIILSSNKIWVSTEKAIVCIAADTTTYNKELGDSHRIVAIYDSNNCSPRAEWTLPINNSPDFPYYIADTCSYDDKHLVIIKGVNTLHLLDVQQNQLSSPITPIYQSNRPTEDAQSGMIIQIEVWGKFIVGYAQDMGTFVFQITTGTSLRPILPYAAYKLRSAAYNSVFLLPLGDHRVQAILPKYDWEEEQLSINPIFDKPLSIQNRNTKNALTDRFVVFQSTDPNKVIGLDLQSGARKTIPVALQNKTTKELIAWMTQQAK